MKIQDCDVEYASDLKDYGRTEDGQPFIGEIYYIVVTNKNGDRLVLNQRFPGVRVVEEEDGRMFADIRPNAIARCEALIARIKAEGYIDLAYWHRDRPAYGSEAYLQYGMEEDVALERMEG